MSGKRGLTKRRKTPRKDAEVEDDILRVVLARLADAEEPDDDGCWASGWYAGITQAEQIVKGTMNMTPFGREADES